MPRLGSGTAVTVPPELEQLLLEYTITVLIDEPDDIIAHAAEYFSNLRDRRNKGGENDCEKKADADADEISQALGNRQERRTSIVGEGFNPDSEGDDDESVETFPKSSDETERIINRIGNIFLFKVMDENELADIADAMLSRDVKKGQTIIREGDDGDYFYVVDTGDFAAYVRSKEEPVAEYEDDGYFGELALLHNQPRAATVKALSDGRLWAMSRQAFQHMVMKRRHERLQEMLHMLESVPDLEPLSEYEKLQVCDALSPVLLEKGQTIFQEGDDGNGMYFVEEGEVSIQQRSERKGSDVEVAKVGRGEFFGELALVKKQPRAGTATASKDSKLAFLDVDAFERLLGPCQELLEERVTSYPEHEE